LASGGLPAAGNVWVSISGAGSRGVRRRPDVGRDAFLFKQLEGDLDGVAHKGRADGASQLALMSLGKAFRGRDIAAQEVAADDGAVALGEALEEAAAAGVGFFALGRVFLGADAGLREAEGHEGASYGAADAGGAGHAAAEARPDAQREREGDAPEFAQSREHGLGTGVTLAETGFGGVSGVHTGRL